MAFRILGTRIEWLAATDLPREGEVLVIPANDHFWMLSGPGLEIKKRFGKEIEIEAVRQGPVEAGVVVATGGAASGYRWIYHAAVMGQDLNWIPGSGETAVRAAIDRAVRDKATSMIFHPLYQGAHGRREGPVREMIAGFLAALAEGSAVKSIQVLYEGAEEKALLQETFLKLLRDSA